MEEKRMFCEYLREEEKDESMSINISWKEKNKKDKDFFDKRRKSLIIVVMKLKRKEKKRFEIKVDFHCLVFEFLSKWEKMKIFDCRDCFNSNDFYPHFRLFCM
jgi:hypothetical protein